MEEKEIIGYKLIKTEYAEAVYGILQWPNSAFIDKVKEGYVLETQTNISLLRQAGVLDLWFESVYKESKPEFKVGDYVRWEGLDPCVGIIKSYRLLLAEIEVYELEATSMPHQKYNCCCVEYLKSITKEEYQKAFIPQITINDYKAEFFDDYVQFGCAKISKHVFKELAEMDNYKNSNTEIESVTIGKGVFSKEVIKEIADYYNNK